MDELNEKLAKWAGFRFIDMLDGTFGGVKMGVFWPDGKKHYYLPDFTNSLDACFKWLVPQLDRIIIEYRPAARGWTETMSVFVLTVNPTREGRARNCESVSRAICLAIEKVIDNA